MQIKNYLKFLIYENVIQSRGRKALEVSTSFPSPLRGSARGADICAITFGLPRRQWPRGIAGPAGEHSMLPPPEVPYPLRKLRDCLPKVPLCYTQRLGPKAGGSENPSETYDTRGSARRHGHLHHHPDAPPIDADARPGNHSRPLGRWLPHLLAALKI